MQLGVGRDLYYPGTEPPAHPITPTVVAPRAPCKKVCPPPLSHQHSAVEMVAVVGKPTLKIELISNGTVTETGKTNGESEKKSNEVVETVVAGDGI